MIPAVVTLNAGEVATARLIANMRQEQNRAFGAVQKYGGPGGEEADTIHVGGCLGEIAVAKYLNLFWGGSLGDYKARDVGGLVEVRNCMQAGRRLILHEEDKDERPFVNTFADAPFVTLYGWVFAREGKQKRFWKDPSGKNRWAFFVDPPLHPMTALVDWVAMQRDGGYA
jgi:hypothetical protein